MAEKAYYFFDASRFDGHFLNGRVTKDIKKCNPKGYGSGMRTGAVSELKTWNQTTPYTYDQILDARLKGSRSPDPSACNSTYAYDWAGTKGYPAKLRTYNPKFSKTKGTWGQPVGIQDVDKRANWCKQSKRSKNFSRDDYILNTHINLLSKR